MNEDEYVKCQHVAEQVAREAGMVIMAASHQGNMKVETKACHADLVTETDQKVEEMIIHTLKNNFPSHKFIGEESTAAGAKVELTDLPTWCIDPVDGTTNFVHNFPYVAVSIALIVNKTPEIGIVYNPFQNEMFTGRRGKGATLNGKSLKVSGVTELDKALLISEFGSSRDTEKMNAKFQNMRRVINRVHGLRNMGSAACNLAAVAAGRTEGYYEFGIHCWDMAAGNVLVQEAGGLIMDTTGGELDLMSRRVLAIANKNLADELVPLLETVYFEKD